MSAKKIFPYPSFQRAFFIGQREIEHNFYKKKISDSTRGRGAAGRLAYNELINILPLSNKAPCTNKTVQLINT